ncbi:hypothetical protein ACQR1W_31565 [Bradyrhizobium sp. HKCCYLS1011]|uniref:hypothetical protein n=1 Tax=Bradyrhizobium sp. HKCCYLS1011 TaxID=3420733 RepID=UPI003EBCDB6D
MQSELANWNAESFRLTLFDVADWIQRPIFAEIAASPPAQINAQPPIQFYQETGNLFDAYLSVTQQGNRVDVSLSDEPTRNTIDPSTPGYRPLYYVGPYQSSLAYFDQICDRTTNVFKRAARLAYAITLIRQTSNMPEAMSILRGYLPTIDFDPQTDRDLAFQINRPTHDRAGKLINRLARWETVQLAKIRVMAATVPTVAPGETTFAARAYVDVNTDAENTVPLGDLPELIRDLRAQAVHMIEHGDTK